MVLLDEMVLDVTKFMDNHPGGKFSIEHNLGRDISKFFHGGYSLENQSSVEPHTHSRDAKKALLSLIIATIEGETKGKTHTMNREMTFKANQTGSIETF